MSLLSITDCRAVGPTLAARGSGAPGEQEGAQCLALIWGVHGSSMSMGSSMHEALGSHFLSMAHARPSQMGQEGHGAAGSHARDAELPQPHSPTRSAGSYPEGAELPQPYSPQSCGHRGRLCLVISPGVPAWLPVGGHSPAGVTRDVPLGLRVRLQPRLQPACGFLESCRDGREAPLLEFQGPPRRGGSGVHPHILTHIPPRSCHGRHLHTMPGGQRGGRAAVAGQH